MAEIYPIAGYAAARIVDVEPAAHMLLANVRIQAASHYITGEYEGLLGIVGNKVKGVQQYNVVARHPHASDIEYSHRIVVNGVDTGKKTKGTYILTNAYKHGAF